MATATRPAHADRAAIDLMVAYGLTEYRACRRDGYSFATEGLEDEGPQAAEEERLRAQRLVLAGRRRQLQVA